ncbi:MAG: FIST N-terminal domain-containing protein [Phycisphaerae bacterium]|jgi:small ligand-binding sensory domain FIST
MDNTDAEMRITTAVATTVQAESLVDHLVDQVRAGLAGQSVDLCLVFASADFQERLDELALELHERLAPHTFAGTSAETVIAGGHEYEGQPALAVWAAHMPGVHAQAFHLAVGDLPNVAARDELLELVGAPLGGNPSFLLFADPFSFNPPHLLNLLERLQELYPGRPVLGGLASAAKEPGQNRLLFEGQTLRHGLVGVALWGNLRVDTVVSQGCRPIGRHMVITRADQNIIYELGGRSPLEVIKHLLIDSEPRDRRLLRERGLLVGCVINEYQKEFGQGDFLIRSLIGIDEKSGAMAVSDLIRTGQTVQFHVRDGDSAAEDLAAMLTPMREARAAGALLFTCNGRGTQLFEDRHHDALAVQRAGGNAPVAGFFCAGEIGPVGTHNFLHGHTASIGFFRAAESRSDG